jgi:hypothetical protein
VLPKLLLLVCSLMIGLSAVTLAQSLPPDPEILIDTGGDPMNITTGISQVQANGSPLVSYDFVNDTSLLTSFMFETMVNKGLDPWLATHVFFGCLNPGGYFLNCSVNYNPTTGDLKYLFSGVLPPDGDETPGPGFDPTGEVGEHEGIPTGGVFHITMVGWIDGGYGGLLYQNRPTFSNSFTTVPEPTSFLSFLAELLLMGCVLTLARNHRNWKRLFGR